MFGNNGKPFTRERTLVSLSESHHPPPRRLGINHRRGAGHDSFRGCESLCGRVFPFQCYHYLLFRIHIPQLDIFLKPLQVEHELSISLTFHKHTHTRKAREVPIARLLLSVPKHQRQVVRPAKNTHPINTTPWQSGSQHADRR